MALIMYYRTRIDFIIVKNVVDVKNAFRQVILIQNDNYKLDELDHGYAWIILGSKNIIF